MIPNTEFFEWIENYCQNQLSDNEKLEFENELIHNNELREEYKLQLEIQAAITENDVLNLREQLQTITGQLKSGKDAGSFELLDDFTTIEEITENISPEDLINFYDSLPKVHVYQHELASSENVHQFYLEQKKTKLNGEDELFDDFEDLDEFEGLEEAIMEKDILNLRETLFHVAKTVKPQFSSEDVDRYISGELTGTELEQFEKELFQNNSLKQEVELHLEVEKAIGEKDILQLRNQLSQIMQTETSWNVTEQDIEDFIDGTLEGKLLDEFNAELSENADLMAEVALRRSINESIGEKDIFALRSSLQAARENAGNTEIKSIIPDSVTNVRQLRDWKRYVAVAILLIGISGIMNFSYHSPDNTYNSFYNPPQWSPERSVTSELNYLNEANLYYNNGDYEKAIELYDIAINEENEKFVFHFYKGASLQNMNKFEEAIPEFNQVIKHGDNLYIEEAEWNKSLCYLKLGNKEMAKSQLEAIIDRNSFYKKDAKAILKRMRYSFK